MASILVVGSDPVLLEGVSQTLIAAGHQLIVAHDIKEALETLHGVRPLVALVNRDELLTCGVFFRVPLARGGALLTFRASDDSGAALPFPIQRATLAELQLPLERNRLLTLVSFVENRALVCGRQDENNSMEDRAR